MTEPVQTTGQVASGPETTTAQTPASVPGQSDTGSQTTAPGSVETEPFFNPDSIKGKPELEAAYKQMQSAFTKRMQSVASNRHKIEAYERFEKDPLGTLTAIAQQYGYALNKPQESKPEEFQPQTWNDVIGKAKNEARAEVLKELEPVINQVRDIRKQSIEQNLNDIDPQWRLYEDHMAENLKRHPSLVTDPATLYRISVPVEIQEKMAMQKALAQIEGKKANQIPGGSVTTKTPQPKLPGKMSFDEAAAHAKAQLGLQ